MNSSKTIFAVIISLLILLSCAATKNYKKPNLEPLVYSFSYDIAKSPSKEKINSPILVTSTDFLKNIDLNYEHTYSEEKVLNDHAIARLSERKLKENLKESQQINEINQKLSSSLEQDVIKILKINGVTNSKIKNSNLHNLRFEDRNNSELIIIPTIELSVEMKRPVQKTQIMGWYPSYWSDDESRTGIGRDQLSSKISLNMNVKVYEPLTEKLLFETKQKNITGISSEEISYFVDSGWKKAQTDSGSLYIKYDGIYCSNYPNLYSNLLSQNYPQLLNKINSSIDDKLITDLISQANSIRERVIPKVSAIETSFKFDYPTQYKKSVNVSAAFLAETKKSEQKRTTGDKIPEIYGDFKSSLSKQINELFDIRGIKIFGEYKSIDDMVYMEKKEAYFVLGLDKDYALKTQNFKSEEMGPISIETSDVNFKGDFLLTMIEPMSKQKLLNKKINVEDTIENTKRVVYSRNNESVVIADTNPEVVAKLLNKAYQNIMQELWTLLSPDNLKNIKSNVNEIRARLGFPAIPY